MSDVAEILRPHTRVARHVSDGARHVVVAGAGRGGRAVLRPLTRRAKAVTRCGFGLRLRLTVLARTGNDLFVADLVASLNRVRSSRLPHP